MQPLRPTPDLHPRRRAGLGVLAAVVLVAALTPLRAAARPAGPLPASAPAAVPLAPPSPELEGLPPLSLDLATVPVEGRAADAARQSYEEADAALRAAQTHRTGLDRAATGALAVQRGLSARAAVVRGRIASTRQRLDQLQAAIADAAVAMYVDGGPDARLDAAMTDEQPSVNEADRKEVLLHASLDVLLADRVAYQQRLDDAEAELAEVEAALAEHVAAHGEALAGRPSAEEAEVAAAPGVAQRRVAYERARATAQVAGVDFSLVALDAYHRAARTMASEDPGCGVQWWAVAGISKVEGRHGTYGGADLLENGDTSRRIIGIPLNGENETAVILDSDGGVLDGDPVYDRAVGPMQFIPQTWARFAADGNGDGTASPFNLYDATLAAARYLCRASSGLAGDDGLRRAYFAYNHSEAYVDTVLGWARRYERAVALPGPTGS